MILAAALTLSGGLNEEFVSKGWVELIDPKSISFCFVAFAPDFAPAVALPPAPVALAEADPEADPEVAAVAAALAEALKRVLASFEYGCSQTSKISELLAFCLYLLLLTAMLPYFNDF